MKLSSSQSNSSRSNLLLAIGLVQQIAQISSSLAAPEPAVAQSVQSRLIDKCCQVGKERAINSQKFNCKLSAREALTGQLTTTATTTTTTTRDLLSSLADSFLSQQDSNFADQCEMVLESCCLAHHRIRNCDSGKQFAKSGAACMDVELSKEATMATESFNDCCMSCSLGILAARNPSANETTNPSSSSSGNSRLLFQSNVQQRCKLISPLALSMSGQLYEQTYIECCQENLPRLSSALVQPGSTIDCAQSNPCAQRCVSAGSPFQSGAESGSPRTARRLLVDAHDRCDCFAGYKLAPDGVNCVDIDECKLNQHTCNKHSEVCDNTRGGFRCLARVFNAPPPVASLNRNPNFLAPINEDQVGEFVSLRLCPLGSRWDSEEKKCFPSSTNNSPESSHSSSSHHHHHSHRSASLFSSSLHLLPEIDNQNDN